VIQRPIPRTGELLPVIGLGTWQTFDIGPGDYRSRGAVLRRFVALGGRLVDSSPMYGRAEAVVGDLATEYSLNEALFVATKVWTRGERRGIAQMEDSIRKLRVARLDLMQVHNLVDVDAHLKTLAEWKAQGKVRYVGVTHYTVESHASLEPFVRGGDIDFVQFNYSLAEPHAERRLLPLCADHGVATIINRPFANGEIFQRVRRTPLPHWARQIGCETWAQVFLKYVIAHPAVTCVIPATADVAHLEENMAAGVEPLPDTALCARIAETWARASRSS
jgi:diketogulonate reductase-like aldo/keto reductase